MIMTMHPNEVRDKIIQTLDRIIHNGRWEGSLFLRNLLKRLQSLRGTIAEKPKLEQPTTTIPTFDLLSMPRVGYVRVYIELYQASCENLSNWEKAIKNLSEHYVSRPVYTSESDVQEFIRYKRSRTDAYLTVWVKQSDIVPQPNGVVVKDRLGHELIRLKEGSVKSENIIEFVHDKINYTIEEDKLVIRGNHASS